MSTKLVIFISGRGSNMQAIINACESGKLDAEVVLVVSNKPNAKGLEFARNKGIPTKIIEKKDYESVEQFEHALSNSARGVEADFICLAGFMIILHTKFIKEWENRIINIHPSLLPKFKGAHAQRDALEAGAKETGCTVHYVTEEVDSGRIILQKKVPVLPDDNIETLSTRILEQEHMAYVEALNKLI